MISKRTLHWTVLAALLAAHGCGDEGDEPSAVPGSSASAAGAAGATASTGPLELTSSEVIDGAMLPSKYRCQGVVGGPTGPNPPLAWKGAPSGTLSFALILRDRTFMNYQHWTIYDIPPETTSLPEGVAVGEATSPFGAKQAANSRGLTGPGYYGPCGPSGMNTYEFKLYALDVARLPNAGTTGDSVEGELEQHDLATASLTVTSGPP